MSRRGAVLAANAATAQRGLAGNSQGAAAAPGSAPSGLLQALGINSSSGQTLQHTGGWGDAYGGGSLPRPPSTFTDGAYGPFSPIIPVPLDEGEPPYGLPPARREQYRVGWNLPVGEPGSEGLKLCTFGTLRTLGDLYSVARACIQYLKSEITSLEWDIMPTRDAAKSMKGSKGQAKDFGKRRAEAVGFFRRPDPDYFSWQTWLSAVMEEILVYDALAIVVRQKWGKGMRKGILGSDLDSLQLISGPTVRPLYDIHGATPRPPAPAYQQYLYGVPRVDMMTMIMERDIEEAGIKGAALGAYRGDQLIYLPFTPRRETPYGFAPIERGLIPIMSGLNKQAYALDFFTEGTVPAVYISPGQEMNPTQIRELQTALNGIAGDPAQHHKIIVLPMGSRVDPQRPASLADQFDEIVMSQVCQAFGVQPMQVGISPKVSTTQSPGAANQMAKASANNQDQGTLQPTLIFLSTIMERVLSVVCGQTDMRFMFDGMQEEEDEETTTNLVVNQTTHALTTIDEGREQLGKEPYGIPESSEPGFLVATGWVPLAGAAEAAQAQRDLAAQPPPAPIIGDPSMTRQALTAPNGKPPASLTGDKPAPGKPPTGGKAPGKTTAKPAAKDPGSQATTATTAAAQAATATQRSNPTAATKAADPQATEQQPEPPPENTTVRDALIAVVGAALAKQLMGIMLDLYAGKIALLQAVAKSIMAMGNGYRHVLGEATKAAAGAIEGTPALPDHRLDDLAATLAEQQRQYVTNMAKAVTNASSTAGDLTWLPARTRMYSSTLNGAWNQAYGDTVEDAHPDYKIIWRLGEAEHCPLCIARDGQEFTFETLPGFPGDGGFGGTICLGGPLCNCVLEYTEGDKVLRRSYNTQRPAAAGYYAQQLQDITARREQMAAGQAAFAESLPAANGPDGTSARSRAMNRNELAARLAQLANQRIRSTGGYSGISVEPEDIPARIIASLLPQYGAQPNVADLPISALMDAVESMFVGRYSEMDITKSAFTSIMLTAIVALMRQARPEQPSDDRRAVTAEMEACARHLAKGRAAADWRREHLTVSDVNTLADLTYTGALTRAECVKAALNRRYVTIDGQVIEPETPHAGLVQGDAAGGGGYVLLPHDDRGIQHDDMSSVNPRPTVGKAASDPGDPNPVEAEHVYNQLLANYPPKSIKWVKDARWIGPMAVDPERVDTQDEDSWAASHQPERVKHFADKYKDGDVVKPGVCVQEPGQSTVKVIDGHHRFLGARKVGEPYMAYVGFVDKDGGPWDEAHSSQFHQGTDPKNKSAETAELSVTHKPLGTHGLWGDKAAQLPAYIQNIAHALKRNGHDESSAIQLAIGIVKRWAAGGGKTTPEVQAAAAGAVAEWEKLKAEHSKSKAAGVESLDFLGKVGPHGYIHGWIFVGVPGVGDEVRHPEHGKGTITAHDSQHVTVSFPRKGVTHTFAVHRAPGEQGHFTERGALEHELGHKIGDGHSEIPKDTPEPAPPVSPKIARQDELAKRALDDHESVKDMTDDELNDAAVGVGRHRSTLRGDSPEGHKAADAGDAIFNEETDRGAARYNAKLINDNPETERNLRDKDLLSIMRHSVRASKEHNLSTPDHVVGHRIARIELDRRVRERQGREDPKDWSVDRLQIHGGTPKQQQTVIGHVKDLSSDLAPEKMAALKHVEIVGPDRSDMRADSMADYHMGNHVMRINPKYLDKASTDAAVERMEKEGWFSKTGHTDGLKRTIDHELGHHLDSQLKADERNKLFTTLTGVMGKTKYVSMPGANQRQFVTDNKAEIVNGVGTYAATNDKELLAELWAEYHGKKLSGIQSGDQYKTSQVAGRYLAGHDTSFNPEEDS